MHYLSIIEIIKLRTYFIKIHFTKTMLTRKHYSICFHIYEKDFVVNALLFIYIHISAVLKKIDKHLSSVGGATLQGKLTDLFCSWVYLIRNSWHVHRSAYSANYDGRYVIKALTLTGRSSVLVKKFSTSSEYTHRRSFTLPATLHPRRIPPAAQFS